MTNKQAYAGLLPCPTPFCAVPEPYIERVGAKLFKVRCKYCQVETEPQYNEAAAIDQWNTRPEAAEAISSLLKRVGELEGAGQNIIDRMSGTYRARNGRQVGIEGDDGEKCWIVHSDDIEQLRAALNSDAPLSIGEGDRG